MQTRSNALQVVQIISNSVERTVSSHQRPVKQTKQILNKMENLYFQYEHLYFFKPFPSFLQLLEVHGQVDDPLLPC